MQVFKLSESEDKIEAFEAQPPFQVESETEVRLNDGSIGYLDFEVVKKQLIDRLVAARAKVQAHIDEARKLTKGAVLKAQAEATPAE